MKKLILFAFLLLSNILFSQNLNSYKYAIIPAKFDFLKQNNQYNLNELLKFGLKKYGFETFYDVDVLPDDVSDQNKVLVNVLENNSMFTTNIKIVIKDFKNNVLFTTIEGNSREKEASLAYNIALRQSIADLSRLKHQYVANINQDANLNSDIIYFYEPTNNGFNLFLDKQIVFKALKTSNPLVFQANKDNIFGTIFKINDKYQFEYYFNNQLITETIQIKF